MKEFDKNTILKETEGCSKCKNNGLSSHQWVYVVVSFYILFSSIYGTIQLFKQLF
jgi:hypothetical protein